MEAEGGGGDLVGQIPPLPLDTCPRAEGCSFGAGGGRGVCVRARACACEEGEPVSASALGEAEERARLVP